MLLSALRAATKPHHDAIEAQLDMLGRSWDLNSYRRLLAGFYGYLAVAEPRMLAFQEWDKYPYDINSRRKLPALVQDLKHLGGERYVDDLPTCPQVPDTTDFASALGYLYVMEGSTLGGQLISRHFRQILGIEPATGGAYFHGYGEQTGARWKETVQFLDAAPAAASDDPQVQAVFVAAAVGGANDTFIQLREWLRQAT